MSGTFAEWQPRYAEYGVATFPVKVQGKIKKPATKGWQRIGLDGSEQLALKFADQEAFGFVAGRRSGVTIGDVDSPSEVALYAGLEMWGDTPLIVKTGSGFHCYYRNNGEGRKVRFLGDQKPYDLLGKGLIVAAPSQTAKGPYKIIKGTLGDLKGLPTMRLPANENRALAHLSTMREGDGRNDELFLSLMNEARGRSFDEITRIAETLNNEFREPMIESEVSKVVAQVWSYERTGRNFIGRGQSMVLSHALYDQLEAAEAWDAMRLLMRLQRVHWHRDWFALSAAMAEGMRWRRSTLREARTTLVKLRIITCIREGGRGPKDPPLYAWNKRLSGSRGYPNDN